MAPLRQRSDRLALTDHLTRRRLMSLSSVVAALALDVGALAMEAQAEFDDYLRGLLRMVVRR